MLTLILGDSNNNLTISIFELETAIANAVLWNLNQNFMKLFI